MIHVLNRKFMATSKQKLFFGKVKAFNEKDGITAITADEEEIFIEYSRMRGIHLHPLGVGAVVQLYSVTEGGEKKIASGIVCEALEKIRTLLEGVVDLGSCVFPQIKLTESSVIDWHAEAPHQFGPYILKHLSKTLSIILTSDHLPPSVIIQFAMEGCQDKELPFAREKLPNLPTGFLLTYLKCQEAYFAVPFAQGEHKVLESDMAVPFVLMPQDRSKKAEGGFGTVMRVMEKKNMLCRKMMMSTEAAEKERTIMGKVPVAPHLLRLRASYIQDGVAYLILEPWVDTDLRKFLDHPKGNPWWADVDPHKKPIIVTGWMLCLAAALETLHSYRIRHIDLHPKSIGLKLVDDNMEPYILDYGLSIHFDKDSKTSTNGGVLFYASPEKADRKKEGRKGDIFSLGLIFMEMISLINPHVKARWKVLVKGRHFLAQVVYQSNWDKDLFPSSSPIMDSLSHIVKRMLARDADSRPHARDVWAHLKRFYDEYGWHVHCQSLVVKPPSPIDKGLKEVTMDVINEDGEEDEKDEFESAEDVALDTLLFESLKVEKRLSFDQVA